MKDAKRRFALTTTLLTLSLQTLAASFPPDPAAPPTNLPSPDPGTTPYGFCYHIVYGHGEAFDIRKSLDMMRDAGADMIRADVNWSWQRKDANGKYDFYNVERSLYRLHRSKMGFLPIININPDSTNPLHEHLDQWADFIRQLATQFKGRVTYWEIMNEHNFSDEKRWGTRELAGHTEHYTAALKTAYETIKSVDPNMKVLYGGTAYVPIDYIQHTLDEGAGNYFDIMNVHPYSTSDLPEHGLGASLHRLRGLLDRYGLQDKPVWVTEIGWSTSPQKTTDFYKKILPAAFSELGLDTRNLPLAYLDDVQCPIYDIASAFPPFKKMVSIPIKKLSDLDPAEFPVLLPMRGEVFARYYAEDLIGYVRKGGIVILPQGVPFCTDAKVLDDNFNPLESPKVEPRRELRIAMAFTWTHGYPTTQHVEVPDIPNGQVPQFSSSRFLLPDWLGPEGRFIPLAYGVDNDYRKGKFAETGFREPIAAVYKYGGDMKGAAIVVAECGGGVRPMITHELQAQFVPRAHLIMFSDGVSKVFWYSFLSGKDGRDTPSADLEANYGIANAGENGPVPKPAYRAYRALTRFLPAGSSRPKIEIDANRVYTAQWRKPDGRTVRAVWTPVGEAKCALPASEKRIAAFDLYGESIQADPRQAIATPSIQYFVYDPDPEQPLAVYNLGICGATSAGIIEKELPQALALQADLFIVMAGCNDLLGNCGRNVTLEAYRANMRKLVAGLSARAPVILLSLTPTIEELEYRRQPRERWPEGVTPIAHLRAGNRILAELAKDCRVPFCDVFTPFMEHDLSAADSPVINPANSGDPDGTHPTPAGYRLIAACLAKTIRDADLAPRRIVCLGDSITCGAKVEGQGTSEGKTYPAQLKAALNALEKDN